jgi:hypothetical protein
MALQLVLSGDESREPSGYDSAILPLPASVYLPGPVRVLNVRRLRDILREATAESCRAANERLHHGVWVITSDPAEVKTRGLMHDCAECLAGVDASLAWLREHPGGEVAVGQLWWAAPD